MLGRVQALGAEAGEDVALVLVGVAFAHLLHALGDGRHAALGRALDERQALLGQRLRRLLLHPACCCNHNHNHRSGMVEGMAIAMHVASPSSPRTLALALSCLFVLEEMTGPGLGANRRLGTHEPVECEKSATTG